MAVIARNEIYRPTFADLPSEGQAVGWFVGAKVAVPKAGGRDLQGRLQPDGVIWADTGANMAAVTAEINYDAGEQVAVWLDFTGAGAKIDLTMDRAAVVPAVSASCVLMPAPSTDPVTLTVPAAGTYWLRISASSGRIYIAGARLAQAADAFGIFSGATPDTDTLAYSWQGDPFASISEADDTPAATDPPPDPDPEASDLAGRAATLLGVSDPALIPNAQEAVDLVTAMAIAYTRDRGVNTDGSYRSGVAEVIISASCRLLGNPDQVDHGLGSEWTRGGFTGWTLAEQFVLNRYRVRGL